MSAEEAVVITGLGIVSPLGQSPQAVSRKLLSGASGVKAHIGKSGAVPTAAALVPGSIKQIGPGGWPLSRASAFTIVAAHRALKDAGLELDDASKLGLVHASSHGNLQSLLAYECDLKRYGSHRASPMQFPNTILHATAGFLSIATGASAFNWTIANGNTSGLDCLDTARQLLFSGSASAILCTAAEDISPTLISVLQVEDSLEQDFPDPFGEDRHGYVPGEGAVALLLETEAAAKRRGRQPWARCRGFASGTAHAGNEASGAHATVKAALDEAKLNPSDVGCVVASANGDIYDAVEARAIAEAFGPRTPITSVKGALGDCGAASGLLSVASILVCGKHRTCPPTLGRSRYDPTLPVLRLIRKPMPLEKAAVLVNAFDKDTSYSCQVMEVT